MNEIPVCYITDENYVMPTVVSALSVLQSNSCCKIFVIGVNLEEKSKKILSELGAEVLEFDNKYENLNFEHTYIQKAIFFKFDLAEIFKDYKKILYLDSDVIVQGNLNEIYNIEIENFLAGVVKDAPAALRYGYKENYFNAGVLYLNLEKIRNEGIKEKLLYDTKENLQNYKHLEQDVFNKIFENKVKFLNPKFNFMTTNCDFSKKTLQNFFNSKLETPLILHYAYKKPWNFKGILKEKVWMKYYKISPYKNEKLNLEKAPFCSGIFKKRKFNDRWVVDFLGLRLSYKKGGRDLKLFYP